MKYIISSIDPITKDKYYLENICILGFTSWTKNINEAVKFDKRPRLKAWEVKGKIEIINNKL